MDRIEQMEQEIAYIRERLQVLEEGLEYEKQQRQTYSRQENSAASQVPPVVQPAGAGPADGRAEVTADYVPAAQPAGVWPGNGRVGTGADRVPAAAQPAGAWPGNGRVGTGADRVPAAAQPAGVWPENGSIRPAAGRVPTAGPAPAGTYQRQLTESMVGKYALPVAAAILIVFGIGALSMMVWNFMPDGGKALLVAFMGLLCFGLGAVLGRSERMRLFKNSMTSVALVILYADVIAMCFAWKMIPDTAALLLIILWCALTVCASVRYRERLFYFVLEAGTCAAALFATELVTADAKGIFLFAVTLLMFAAGCICYWAQFRGGSNMLGAAALFIFWTQAVAVDSVRFFGSPLDADNMPFFIMRGMLLVSMLVFAWFHERILYEPGNGRQNGRALVAGCILTAVLPIITYALAAPALFNVLFCLLMLRQKNGKNVLSFATYPHLVTAVLVFADRWNAAVSGLTVLAVCFFVISQLSDEARFRIQFLISETLAAFVWAVVYALFFVNDMKDLLVYGLPFILTSGVFVIITMLRRQQLSLKFSLSAFVTGLYIFGSRMEALGSDWASLFIITVSYLILAAVCLWMQERDGEADLFSSVWSGIAELILIAEYAERSQPAFVVTAGVLLVVQVVWFGRLLLFGRQVKRWKDMLFAFLCSFNILLLAERTPLGDISILISLLMMAAASVFIICGFQMRRKGFRLYGLIFIILSVAKMILYDIAGSGSILRVAALIAGGVICLAISYVYNRLEKRLQDQEEGA